MVFPVKADITLPARSGILGDDAHIGLYYDRGVAPVAADFDNFKTHIASFFTSIPTGAAVALQNYLAAAISNVTNAATIRFYAVPAVKGPLGAPIATRQFTIATPATDGLPSEMAMTLSYQRAYGSDVEFGAGGTRPRSSDRGRVYIGPLSFATIHQDTTSKKVTVDSGAQSVLTKAAHDFLYSAMLADSWVWLQFSHKLWDWDAVTNVWVDDAFDVQRRRGVAPSVKTSLALP